jgi:hypothetical protein
VRLLGAVTDVGLLKKCFHIVSIKPDVLYIWMG